MKKIVAESLKLGEEEGHGGKLFASQPVKAQQDLGFFFGVGRTIVRIGQDTDRGSGISPFA
jgi:hypothetical protein